MAAKKIKRLKMDAYNQERREARRLRLEYTDDDLTVFKTVPSHQELKDALREATTSHTAIIRLAALMDNLAMHKGRRLCSGSGLGCRNKTDGIKAYLRKDGYLYSRYSSLMRYRKLGKLLREKSGVGIETNLLWGLESTCPTDDGEPLFEDEYNNLHALYESFAGMHFTQINDLLKKSYEP